MEAPSDVTPSSTPAAQPPSSTPSPTPKPTDAAAIRNGAAVVSKTSRDSSGKFLPKFPAPRGRGRHPKDCDCGRCKGSARPGGPSPVGAAGPSAPVVLLDPDTVKRSVAAVLKAVDSVVVRKVYRTAREITAGDPASDKLAREYAGAVQQTATETETIAELSAIVASKYDLLGRYAPEGLLVIALGSYAVRVVSTLRQLENLSQQVRANKVPLEETKK
jgi:hypothetical protein